MAPKKWKKESWSTTDEGADQHNSIEYGWNEDWGYWFKLMDDRLKMADDWHSPWNTLAELDRFRASVLDGGREGCYLSVYTGPRGQGKRVDFEVMMDLWNIYHVPNVWILSEFRNLSEREIQEVSDTVEAKIDDEWVNPWARKCECDDCEAFDALVPKDNKNNKNDESDESDESDENDEDEDEDD